MKWFVVPTLMLAALPFFEAPPASGAPGDANPCIEPGAGSVWGGLGWNHVIYLTNRYCNDTVVCAVSTDVDSCVQQTLVPPSETVAVLTALNSQAQAFIPNIACDYPPKPPP
jgi:hypothetical protein